nr:S-layer homology domain-containing protein [uncultured Butyricicoccus sp.]
MRHPLLTRLVCAGLSAVLTVGAAGASLIEGGFTYSFRIGVGTTYSNTYAINSAGTQRANAIEYKPSSDVSPIGVRSGTQFYGNKKTLSQAAAGLESQGYDVIGGINADFFSTENGIPTGLVVDNGRIIACNTWQSAVGFRADGSALIGQPVTSITVSGASGNVGVYGYNKTRTSVGLYLLDSYYYSQTRFSTPGQSIILEYKNKSDLRISQPAKFKVVGKVSGSESFAIGENQMILTKRDDCKSAWIDYPVGEELTITFNSMTAGWDSVKYAVGGKTLVTNGQSTPTSIDRASANCARTAVGTKPDGTVVLFEVDGESSYSRGLNANALAAEMIARGCTTAVCLDGGGSSMMTIQKPGESTSKLISKPSDGSERKVSNFVFLVNNKKSDGVPTYLYLVPTARYVLLGADVSFSVTALDDASVKTALPGDVTYTVSGGSGSASGGVFTAGSSAGPVTVYAQSGAATGDMQLMVIGDITTSTITSGGKEVSSVSVAAEQSIDLDATVSYNGFAVASQDDVLHWSVKGDIGTVDANGVFTGTKKGSGSVVMSYGSYSKSIPVSVGMGAPQPLTTIADFEDNQPLTASGEVSLNRTEQADSVARGYGALAATANGNGTISLPQTTITQTPTLSMWAKVDGSAALTALFTDASGETLEAALTPAVGSSWQFLSCKAPEGAQTLTGLRVSGNGTLYLDHIQVSEAAPLSTSAPAITFTSAPTTALVGDSVTVTAKITQEHDQYPVRTANVKAYINGTLSSAKYSESSASISVPTGQLGAGLHTVVIEAADDAGNLSRQAVTITVGKNNTHAFVDTSKSWAADYIDRLSARGIMQGSTVDGKKYYYPNSNLKRSEFAAMMARTLGLDTSSTERLDFVDNDDIPSWARGPIAACVRAGLMAGSSTGRFNPNSNITRAEVMTVISRSLPRGYVPSSKTYTDQSEIPDWALTHVQTVTAIGLVGGYRDGSIQPNARITRAEIAKIFCYL